MEIGNWVNGLIYGVSGLAFTCVVLLVTFQEKLVYVPVIPGMSKGYPITPARLGLRYEDVWLHAEDGVRLHSWFIKMQPPVQDIAHRLEFVDLMMRRLRCNVFMLSYRGYGASDGQPSQSGLILDAQAALNHLLQREDIDHKRIVVFGRSLGGAVGATLVKKNPGKIAGLILENTFTSILDMAGIMLPVLKWVIGGKESKGPKPLNWLVRSPWKTIEIVEKISEPILYLSGSRDEMVPPSHMQKLYDASHLNPNRRLVTFPNGMHMDTWIRGGDRYWRAIELFLQQHANGHDEMVSASVDELTEG